MTDTQATGNGAKLGHSGHRTARPWKPFLVFVLFAFVISLAGNFIFQHYKGDIKGDKQEELGGIAELKVKQITDWLAERRGDAQTLKDDPMFLSGVDHWLQQGGPDDEVGAILKRRMVLLQQNHAAFGYVSISLFDRNATLRLSTSAEEAPLQGMEKVRLLECMSTGQIKFSDIHREQLRSGERVEIELRAPLILSRNGKPRTIGAILFRIDPYRFLFPLIQRWPTPSPSAENLLIRRDGEEAVFLNELRYRKNTAVLSLRLPLSQRQRLAVMAALGQEGLVEGEDYRGVQVVGVLNKVPGTSWTMVSKIDKAEIYASANNMGYWMALLVLTLISMGGGITVFWRQRELRQYKDELEREVLTKHLDYLAKYANDIILLLDSAGKLVEFNDRALEAFGYSPMELSCLKMADLVSEDFTPSIAERLLEIDRKGALRFESLNVRKDGLVFPAESSMRLVTIGGEKYYQAIIRDITEHKQAEDGLRKLNRALRLLSACDAALVHAEDEGKLLAEICELIVEVGGYRMVWVGFAEHDEQKSVRPVARYGFEDGYLDNAGITWSDTERGRGPTGTAIRTGVTQINQNFLTNSATALWCEAALKRGYQASIALPLRGNGTALGALTIYSVEPCAFNTEEVRLLRELADDLSYGITTLRMRTGHRLAEEDLKFKNALLTTEHELSIDGILAVDKNGEMISFNRRFISMWGISEEVAKSRSDERALRSVLGELADPAGFLEKVRYLYAHEQETSHDEVLLRDGRVFERYTAPMTGSDGKHYGRIWYFRDITEHKRAEEYLWKQKKFMQQIIDTDPNRIFVKNAMGHFLLVNRSTAEAHGMTPDEMIGKSHAEAYRQAEEAGHLETDRQVIKEGNDVTVTEPYSLPGGEKRWLLTTKKRLVMPDGTLGVLGIAVDITEQKLAELRLAKSYKKLQQLSLHLENARTDERAKIALNLHDEMGATLAALKMRIAWLASKLPAGMPHLADEVEQMAGLVSGGVQTLRRIVGQLRPNLLGDIGLAAAVEDYVEKFRQHMGIKCRLTIPKEDFALDVNQSVTVFRILQESLNNVVKHAQANQVSVILTKRKGKLLLVIKDDGVGFDSATNKEQSFGLLGIRERALMVGGKARVSSVPGKGTRVSVSIPLGGSGENS